MTKKEERERERAEKAAAKLAAETERIRGMRTFERAVLFERFGGQLYSITGKDEGTLLIAGIDEAGRGPLAGPVAAGACILPLDSEILYLNDSKKLSEKKREELFAVIQEKALAWAVGLSSPEEIDRMNILQATYLAMRRAIEKLDPAPDALINDAVMIPDVPYPQAGVVKGDAKCASISAASILAKVTRDHLMLEYDREYPMYGFAGHKGYGTAAHIAALKEFGPCPIHRRSFIGHFVDVGDGQ